MARLCACSFDPLLQSVAIVLQIRVCPYVLFSFLVHNSSHRSTQSCTGKGSDTLSFLEYIMAKFFFVEITDTFSGEANYSWVTRHKVKASTIQGAIGKVSRDSGLSFRKTMSGEVTRYDSKSGATCAFVEEWDDDAHENQNHSLALA